MLKIPPVKETKTLQGFADYLECLYRKHNGIDPVDNFTNKFNAAMQNDIKLTAKILKWYLDAQ